MSTMNPINIRDAWVEINDEFLLYLIFEDKHQFKNKT